MPAVYFSARAIAYLFCCIIFILVTPDTHASESSNEAIGRINYAGHSRRTHCTGVLVSKQIVITAAHCLYSNRFGNIYNAKSLHFLAGYEKGKWLEHAKGDQVITFDNYLNESGKINSKAPDIGLLVQERPLNIKHAGFTKKIISSTTKFSFTGYRRGSAHVQSSNTNCRLLELKKHYGKLSCKGEPGLSGSPVFIAGENKLAGIIVGVNTAKETFFIRNRLLKKLMSIAAKE